MARAKVILVDADVIAHLWTFCRLLSTKVIGRTSNATNLLWMPSKRIMLVSPWIGWRSIRQRRIWEDSEQYNSHEAAENLAFMYSLYESCFQIAESSLSYAITIQNNFFQKTDKCNYL